MNIKDILQRPATGTGNAGMKTPYEQGFYSGAAGERYDNPYDQPGEEVEAMAYFGGWKNGESAGLAG